MFGETEFDPNRIIPSVSFEDQLTALDKAICAGKVSASQSYSFLLLNKFVPVCV